MLNVAVLIGRLTRDPELRYTPSGQAVASFTLAVDRPFTNQQGEREADFVNVVCWHQLAEMVTNHHGKGALVVVRGGSRCGTTKPRTASSARPPRSWRTRCAFWSRTRPGASGRGQPHPKAGRTMRPAVARMSPSEADAPQPDATGELGATRPATRRSRSTWTPVSWTPWSCSWRATTRSWHSSPTAARAASRPRPGARASG